MPEDRTSSAPVYDRNGRELKVGDIVSCHNAVVGRTVMVQIDSVRDEFGYVHGVQLDADGMLRPDLPPWMMEANSIEWVIGTA